jgi:hypothetical protein
VRLIKKFELLNQSAQVARATSEQAVMSAVTASKSSAMFGFPRSFAGAYSRLVAAFHWLFIGRTKSSATQCGKESASVASQTPCLLLAPILTSITPVCAGNAHG